MKRKLRIYSIILITVGVGVLLSDTGCIKNCCNELNVKAAPKLTTNLVSAVTPTTVTCGGTITTDGGDSVTARGVCWSTTKSPTISDSTTSDSTGIGAYTSSITGLIPFTTYYIRAYARNTIGIAYGNQQSFTTLTASGILTLTTTQVTNITQTTATSGGTITSDGGSPVTAKGACWSTSPNPTTANTKTSNGNGVGNFTSLIINLTANTTYYLRAYATNSIGTAYGNQQTFSTQTAPGMPTLTTAQVTNITQTSATSGGTITSDGGSSVSARGVCWNTSPNPSTADSKTSNGNGTGTFVSNLTNLTANTTYYLRAYATNSAGTAYGNQQTFSTLPVLVIPTLTTAQVINITQITATSGGTITSDGGAPVTARGVCWSTSPNPTTANSKTSDGSGTGSFSSSITSLTANTTYYLRAYATNSAGTAYGNQQTFSTLPVLVIPTLTTAQVINITQITATSGGSITSDGGSPVTVRGVCWSTSTNPTTADSKTSDGSGTGNFTSSLTGLTPNTPYYVRAYATNGSGTAYGNLLNFTTQPGTGGTVTDIDGNVYTIVTIGTQVWMVENLKTTKYNDGAAIPLVTDGAAWANLTTPGYCWYNNDITNKNTYGALYNWYAVNTGKLCPTGWHVPTDAEWTTLTTYLGGESVAGGKMKSTGTIQAGTGLWQDPNTGATNESGFTAVPAGHRDYNGTFYYIGSIGYWWSSSEYIPGNAWYRHVDYGSSSVSRLNNSNHLGFSVRCVRD